MAGAKFKTGVYPAPAIPGSDKVVAPMHADTFAIPAKSKSPEAAWKVLKWLNSAETSAKLAPIYGLLPARKSIREAWEKETVTKYPYFDIPLILQSGAYADSPNHEGAIPNQSEAKKAYDVFWNNVRTDPNLDIKKALDELNAVIQGIYEGKIPPTPTPGS
jgi:ABC-type glycerol-3-phosphate transport system substrate-binding protein